MRKAARQIEPSPYELGLHRKWADMMAGETSVSRCGCGNPRLADFFVVATVGRPIADGTMEIGYSDGYVCAGCMPADTNDLLSVELQDEGWQVYRVIVGPLVPTSLH